MRETSNDVAKDFDRCKDTVNKSCDHFKRECLLNDADVRTVEHIQHGIQAARRAGAVSDESVAIFLAGYLA